MRLFACPAALTEPAVLACFAATGSRTGSHVREVADGNHTVSRLQGILSAVVALVMAVVMAIIVSILHGSPNCHCYSNSNSNNNDSNPPIATICVTPFGSCSLPPSGRAAARLASPVIAMALPVRASKPVEQEFGDDGSGERWVPVSPGSAKVRVAIGSCHATACLAAGPLAWIRAAIGLVSIVIISAP